MDTDSESDDQYEEEIYIDSSLTVLCLFCNHVDSGNDEMFKHILIHHLIDINSLINDFKLDSFLYIKLINFIRSNGIKPENLVHVLKTNDNWKDDKFMIPTLANDSLLLFDVEGDSDENDNDFKDYFSKVLFKQAKLENEPKLKLMENKTNFLKNENNYDSIRSKSDDDSDEEYYFSSYSNLFIHYEMLSDKVRTNAYRDAILKSQSFIEGKHLLDIGCGTGILSLFAASLSNPKSITAVDQSDIIYYAMAIAEENLLSEKIFFRKGKLENLKFDKKYDVIVSEWMGYFLLFEGMLDTFLWARDNLLNSDGKLMPNHCKIFIAGLEDFEVSKSINFWDDVYGFKMKAIKRCFIKEVNTCLINPENIVTNSIEIKDLNLNTCSIEESQNIQTKFEFNCSKSGHLNAIVAWFDCFFENQIDSPIVLSTSPYAESTHWKQSVLWLEKPIVIEKEKKIKGRIKILRKNRSLSIILKIGDKTMKYLMK